MQKKDVLKIILDERSRLYHLVGDSLTNWFWKVGFREIKIDDGTVCCNVDRPNQFISNYRKPIGNFLIHIIGVFQEKGYTFKLCKYKNNEYYNMLLEYLGGEK